MTNGPRKTGQVTVNNSKFAHEMEAGDTYEPLEFTITPEINQQFLFALEDFDPQYVVGDGKGAALVHPVLLLHMSARTRSPSFRLATDSGSIFAQEHVEFLNPARVEQKLRTTWRIAETYEKRGRLYHRITITIDAEDGTPILRREMHDTVFFRDEGQAL